MLQRLFGRDALLRVVNEDSLEEVEELPVERGVGRDEFLRLLVKSVGEQPRRRRLTVNRFMALTYFRDARVVSSLG